MITLIEGGELVLKDKNKNANIYIEDGIITHIVDELLEIEPDKIVDATGCYVMPGLVDINCEVRVPGYEYKEDIESITQSALAGGYTTLTASPNTDPVIDNRIIVEHIKSNVISGSKIDIKIYGNITKGGEGLQMADLGEMYSYGVVAFSDGNEYLEDSELLNNIYKYSEIFELPIILSCTDKLLRGDGMINDGYVSPLTGLKAMPVESEDIAVARNVMLARNKNIKLHLTKLSTKSAVEILKFAKKSNNKITCDTAPHYFALTESVVQQYDSNYKVMPPLRSKEDAYAIKVAIQEGDIDCICSAHSPEGLETKRIEFEYASFGVSSLETTLLVSYNNLVCDGSISINKLMQLLSTNPAKILGLDDIGSIEVGKKGNFVIFNPNEKTVIDDSAFLSKAKFSMFNGLEYSGRVVNTVYNGDVLY